MATAVKIPADMNHDNLGVWSDVKDGVCGALRCVEVTVMLIDKMIWIFRRNTQFVHQQMHIY